MYMLFVELDHSLRYSSVSFLPGYHIHQRSPIRGQPLNEKHRSVVGSIFSESHHSVRRIASLKAIYGSELTRSIAILITSALGVVVFLSLITLTIFMEVKPYGRIIALHQKKRSELLFILSKLSSNIPARSSIYNRSVEKVKRALHSSQYY